MSVTESYMFYWEFSVKEIFRKTLNEQNILDFFWIFYLIVSKYSFLNWEYAFVFIVIRICWIEKNRLIELFEEFLWCPLNNPEIILTKIWISLRS